jgi:hypothetical protein
VEALGWREGVEEDKAVETQFRSVSHTIASEDKVFE